MSKDKTMYGRRAAGNHDCTTQKSEMVSERNASLSKMNFTVVYADAVTLFALCAPNQLHLAFHLK